MFYTVLKEPFADWVKAQVHKRNQQLVQERGHTIDMDPELAAVLNAYSKVSGK